MEIHLQKKVRIRGYSKMFGVSPKRIKIVALYPNRTIYTSTMDRIRQLEGQIFLEYRLVFEKEKNEYVWRNTLSDCGINGGHSSIKAAITSIVGRFKVYIDEDFTHSETADFKKWEKVHALRHGCSHPNSYTRTDYTDIKAARVCPDCITTYNIIP